MEKRTLITTAVFNKTDKPTIFLGNWCLNNFNYNLWEAMDYEIHQSEIFKCKNSFRLVRDSEKIYESILDDLSIVLNRLHKINWKKKSWRMVIGPWLYRYVSIFHKNIELIKEIKKNPTVIIDEEISINSNIKLETSDLWDFTNQIYNDNLNKDIFSIAISKIFNKEKIYEKFKKLNNQGDLGINKENIKKISFFTILKNYLLKIFERILCFNNKTIFYKIYYGNTFSLLKIFLKLKEVPFKYNFKEERNISTASECTEIGGEWAVGDTLYVNHTKGTAPRTHNIHCYESNDPEVDRHLAYRDYLRAHSDIAAKYESLKRQIAANCNHDIEKYCAGKDPFIKHHQKLALDYVGALALRSVTE